MKKKLYVCCYDISDEKIRSKVHKIIKQQHIGGQYSAYECYLTLAQKISLEESVIKIMQEHGTLKLQIVHKKLDIICLGSAIKPSNLSYMYFG